MVDKIVIKDQIPSNKIIIKESITKIYPSLENLNIVPSKQEQVFEHENSYGYDKVTVEPIEIKLQNKEIIPSNIDKEVTFDNNYDGLSKVTIKGDSNLIAANIKQNINIFGITGTYEGNDFNIYMQPNEPIAKNGIWLKSDNLFNGVKFFDYATAKGEVLEAEKFSFIDVTGMSIIAQEIIDGEMYLLTNNNTSKKINLETKTVTTLKSTSLSGGVYCGSCYYKGLIYIFAADSNYFYWKYYDVVTDTFSAEYNSGRISNMGTTPANDTRAGVHVFDGKAYVFFFATDRYIGGNHVFYAKFDLEKNTYLGKQAWSQTNISRYSSISGYGQYVYFIFGESSNNSYLQVIDLVNNTYSSVVTFEGTRTKVPFATADAVYAFEGTGGAQKSYMKYDLLSKTIETVTANNTYFVAQTYTVKPIMLNDKNGILYFRAGTASGMQFLPSPELDDLPVGSVAVIQSPNNNSVKIQDSSNLHIGVDNVYLKTSNGLITGPVFLGDGVKWNLLKNPTGETATVTFNTNGGSTIPSEQVVIGQKISAPSTPSKAGYVFDDWYLNGEPFDFNKPIVEDITLVAGWETYEVIDYIESSGTQYIDTGVKTGLNIKVEAEFACLGTSDDLNYSGAVYSGSLGWIATGSYAQGYLCSYFCDSSRNGATIPFDNNFHTYLCSNGLQKVDDTQTNITATSMPTTLNLFIFKGNVNFSATFSIKQRVKYYKIYDNGTLVRNFIPIKTEKGAVGLLDQVNNVAYYNVGTGSFTGGKLQEPVQLSYIESTGTQYIDTGFTHNQNTKLEIKTSFNNIDQIEAIVNSSNNNSPYNNFNLFKINNEYRTDYAESFKSIPEVTFSINTPYIFLQDKNKSYVDGTLVATHPTATFTGSYPIRLLAKTSNGARQMRGKVYYCKIWDNETLVRDFVPWKDEFGIICLHDNVENKNYYNQGTGTFIAGNEV